MTEIARINDQNNRFKNISMYRPPQKNQENDKSSLDEKLNKIAGKNKETQFVDRANHNKLDKDGFLKLLTHQLAHQDPLKPMDQKEFAADLAQFSQLEQMTNMNTKLENLLGNRGAEGKFYGVSFLGKKVMTKGSSVNHPGGKHAVKLPFYLPKKADHTLIRVFDSKNQTVAQLEPGALSSGGHSIMWDGMAMDGTPATKDTYTFKVLAWTPQGDAFNGETRAEGLVTGVSFDGSETVLEVDNKQKIFLRDVHEIHVADADSRGAKKPGLRSDALQSYNQMSQE